MSSATKSAAAAGANRAHENRGSVGSGTNSPPAEGGTMGYADIDGKIKAGHVSDREQRKEYFDNADKGAESHGRSGERFMGQSMADEQDRQT